MVAPRSGGNRPRRTTGGRGQWPILAAVVVTLIVGTALGRSTMATAQSIGQPQDPSFFPSTGYRITSPAILDYFLHRGGVRSLGYPISNDFPLLGKRVQLFQRQMLEVRPDGTVSPLSVLDPQLLPVTHIDGLTLPPVDPDLVGAAPSPTNPDYVSQALSYVNTYVSDTWNDDQVNFLTTYLETVTCQDAFGDEPCDPSQLAADAFELWGLPTSLPTPDPLNNDFIYQRFERGIMHYSRTTGLTQGLLVGDWLKRVMVGLNLSPDLDASVRASRVYGQFTPGKPLGLARPDDLPNTSLAQAFRADTLSIAQASTPTLPSGVAATATAVALTATAITGTQVVFESTSVSLTSTAVAAAVNASATVVSSVPTATVALSAVSDIPVTNAGCLGDEQMWFIPRKPNVGTHVEIAVTSQRHHDVRNIRLVGPLDSGVPTERLGPLGFTWTWTVVPVVEDFHNWTFYADGLRPCITSGFNTTAPLGATASPTATRQATDTPAPTTPTATPLPPRPIMSQVNPSSGNCNQLVQVIGRNFGANQAEFGGAIFFNGANGTRAPTQIFSWTTNEIDLSTPGDLVPAKTYQIIVSTAGGSSQENITFNATPGNFCTGTVT
jgi:hypothetical protein